MEVNVHEAKSQLSKLIERVRMGDEVVIAKAGKPVVKLVPVDRPARRVFGSAKGEIVFKRGWNAPMSKREIERLIR
jgi:prevent-host-death family protein